MQTELSNIFLGLISSFIIAFISYFFAKKGNKYKQLLEKSYEQKYKYFFPFKHQSIEFKYRIKHIIEALETKRGETEEEKKHNYNKMKSHFIIGASFESAEKDWFFIDFYDRTEGNIKPGGYFFYSTLYLHCLLFRQINILLTECPFIELQIATIDRLEKNHHKILENECTSHGFINKYKIIESNGKKQDINTLIEAIRLSTVFSGGLSYNLHNSFGAYISKPDGVMNYEEFCNEFKNEVTRIKFSPLIKFWEKLGGKGEEYEKTFTSLHCLYIALDFVECAELKG